MEPNPETTHLLWCDFNSEEEPDDLGGRIYSTLAPRTHDGLALQNGLEVFIFDYDDFEHTEIVGHKAVIELVDVDDQARTTTDEGWWGGPLPLGFCRSRNDIDWYYKYFPECTEE